jgi:hypothetical protein
MQVPIQNAQQRDQVLSQRPDLLFAIGRGIGVSAAHEVAHQFLINCCDMDADPETDPLARGAYNAKGCSGAIDPSPWTGFWASPEIILHWESNTAEGVDAQRALQQCLSKGQWSDPPKVNKSGTA